ncbi:tRNA (adenosine(37)-N6)-threonylcarbamoyltransferase complex dimerization subunit type 1 TsaB [Amaricoccus sp.]|uniref:tRNA (adenosine(37)-N6)-threonylcarbamoyltransferase complex dimerization subunit type 1 TsaB n=1 Tax=Amaricoccus sp. TaxID=1872485 RepID=UPI002636CCF8|nr:tRNA (adenosine(37)-N6)-threonylcarbamoyltransferase complex dimerization subunit type 1 TsaB [Amaricoccus sp.]HRO10559.1 tRNA (adenosine(37)-N6)-threonylcarbamoyltransferase complex dimerization subunit type 1 TsaB [Amaricoccus sp.]
MASDQPLVLAFDTAAARCAAALVRGDALLARRVEPMDRGQAERLLPMLEELLAEAGVAWPDLDGIGVVTGPGNFTGVRLAVAAARGLALSLGIPAVGVSVFEALADRPGAVTITLADKRGRFAQSFRDGVALAPPVPLPGDGPAQAAQADPAVVARLAARRLGAAPPPAPLYLRPADATPSSDPLPVLLDDA